MASELQEAAAAVDAAQSELDRLEALAAEARRAAEDARLRLDDAIIARDGPKRPHQDMEDRLAYIHRQAEVRAERAGRSKALYEKLGADVGDLEPRAPIDTPRKRKAADK